LPPPPTTTATVHPTTKSLIVPSVGESSAGTEYELSVTDTLLIALIVLVITVFILGLLIVFRGCIKKRLVDAYNVRTT
jgi:hypothetical protein